MAATACAPPRETPARRGDGWQTAAPAAVGLDAAPLRAMAAAVADGSFPHVHAILIVRDGRLAFERYFPGYRWEYSAPEFRGAWTEFGPDTPHNLASVTKSVTGILVAIALDEGAIDGVDAPVCPFFPEDADLCTGKKATITVRHLLMMASGLAWNEQDVWYGDPKNDIVQLFLVPDPIRYILAKPLAHDPGTSWYYDGGGTNLLGEIVRRATGERLDAFARRRLFEPLGIRDASWRFLRPGLVYASGDMTMRPRDMAKLGQLILDHGTWRGRRVLSAARADALVERFVRFNATTGYGYQWWLKTYTVGARSFDAFCADGWGGQRILGVPALHLVAVFTGGSYTADPRLDELVTRFILPAAISGGSAPASPATSERATPPARPVPRPARSPARRGTGRSPRRSPDPARPTGPTIAPATSSS